MPLKKILSCAGLFFCDRADLFSETSFPANLNAMFVVRLMIGRCGYCSATLLDDDVSLNPTSISILLQCYFSLNSKV